MPRVLMNFQHNKGWTAHFLEADCQTPVCPGRFCSFATLDALRGLLLRAGSPAQTFEVFDHAVRAWGRGSVYLDLTTEQYARLSLGGHSGKRPGA